MAARRAVGVLDEVAADEPDLVAEAAGDERRVQRDVERLVLLLAGRPRRDRPRALLQRAWKDAA